VEIDDTLDFLLGTWSVSRSIEDHRSSTSGSFDGTASFTELPLEEVADVTRGARYDEEGELRFAAFCGPTHRSLLYVQRGDARVEICFSDGRHYVDLDLRRGSWQTEHPCSEDLYEITTELRSRDQVEERWKVRGPTKDFDAVTTLVRIRGLLDG
jgi:hypothetical protein